MRNLCYDMDFVVAYNDYMDNLFIGKCNEEICLSLIVHLIEKKFPKILKTNENLRQVLNPETNQLTKVFLESETLNNAYLLSFSCYMYLYLSTMYDVNDLKTQLVYKLMQASKNKLYIYEDDEPEDEIIMTDKILLNNTKTNYLDPDYNEADMEDSDAEDQKIEKKIK